MYSSTIYTILALNIYYLWYILIPGLVYMVVLVYGTDYTVATVIV